MPVGRRVSASGWHVSEDTGEMLQHLLLGARPAAMWSRRAWVPPTDVYQTKDAVIIRMELAGVDPDSIHIEAHPSEVIVRGVREDCHQGCKQCMAQMEIAYGPFERIVAIHVPVSPRRTQARYQAGMLEIALPKLARPRRAPVSRRTSQITIRLL